MNPSLLLALFGLCVVAKKPAAGAAPATGTTGAGPTATGSRPNVWAPTTTQGAAAGIVGTWLSHPVYLVTGGGARFWNGFGWTIQQAPWVGHPTVPAGPTGSGGGDDYGWDDAYHDVKDVYDDVKGAYQELKSWLPT